MLSVVATKHASDTVTRPRVFFFRVFKASEGKREASEERSYKHNGEPYLRKGSASGCTPLLCQCQDGYQHFSRDTHNFPNFPPSPSTTPSDPFSAAEISAMELSPGEGLRLGGGARRLA